MQKNRKLVCIYIIGLLIVSSIVPIKADLPSEHHKIILDPNFDSWDDNDSYAYGSEGSYYSSNSTNNMGDCNVGVSTLWPWEQEEATAGFLHWFEWTATCDVPDALDAFINFESMLDSIHVQYITQPTGWINLKIRFSFFVDDDQYWDTWKNITISGGGDDDWWDHGVPADGKIEDLEFTKYEIYDIGVGVEVYAHCSGWASGNIIISTDWLYHDVSDTSQVNIYWTNRKPEKPSLTGETNGVAGTFYDYTASTTDPSYDDLFYIFFWGYGFPQGPYGPYASGADCVKEHKWDVEDTYKIWVKAEDGLDASERTYLTVTMPKYTGCDQGTLINMAVGSSPSVKNIEDIEVGDYISSYDTKLQMVVPAEVTAVYNYTELPENPLDINYNFENNIEVTPNLFLFINGTEWMKANDTGIDYYVLENTPGTNDTSLESITSINESLTFSGVIYDLEIKPLESGNVSGYFADGILVGYNPRPKITNVSDSPDTVGFGSNVIITADVIDDINDVDAVKVLIAYPDDSGGDFSMNNTVNDTYEYCFNDTWLVGQYDYTIWAIDKSQNINISWGHSFNVSSQAIMSVCTLKDEYGDNEIINITDPPSGGGDNTGWTIIERGANFVRRQNITDPNLFSWESAPQWIYDGTAWVLYIFGETDDYYQVQSGLIGTRIYKNGYAEFWNPDMTEVRLYEEMWTLEYYDSDQWKVCDVYSPTFIVDSDTTTINITASFITDYPNSGERAFDVKYIFREGMPLKHEIIFTSHSTEECLFRVKQKWAGIVTDKVKHSKGIDNITSPITINSSYFEFEKSDGNLSIFENQQKMYYGYNETTHRRYILENHNLKPVEIDVHAQGLKADFVFGNWTLSHDESLEIDPDTATLDDPTEYGFIVWDDPDYLRVTDEFIIRFGREEVDFRGYSEWDVSSLAGATLTANPVFKYNGELNLATDEEINPITEEQPSDGGCTDAELYGYIASETAYVEPFNFVADPSQEQDLGASAKTDLQNAMDVSQSWFAIGFQSPADEGQAGMLLSIAASPILYVEYTPEPPDTIKYYFNSYDFSEWTNPDNMVDGSTLTFADIIVPEGGVQELDGNTCPGTNLGTITKVELRFHGYAISITEGTFIRLIPYFDGVTAGDEYSEILTTSPFWSAYFDITSDSEAPSPWTWGDIQNLWGLVVSGAEETTYYCSKVEIRVTVAPNTSVDTIIPYNQTSSPLTITASSSPDLDNVTLWYRYSTDNSSWGEENWWDSSWTKRTLVNLSVSSGETEENHTVLLNVSYDADMNNNFSDLRFVRYADNATLLDYWIESQSNGNWCNVWVEFRDNITTTYQPLAWMHYGNPGAGSLSNGFDTFLFFDDFSGDSLNSSIWPTQSGSITVSDGAVHLDFPGTSYAYAQSNSQDYIGVLEFRSKYTYDSNIARFGSFIKIHYGGTYGGRGIHIWDSGDHILNANDPGVYHKYKIVKTSANASWYFDGNYKFTRSKSGDVGTLTLGNNGEAYREGDVWFDYIFTRKYASSEPTYSIGGEQDNNDWMVWSNASNPDTSSPWSWEFDFPNGVGYYEFYSIGKKSGQADESLPGSADARCCYRYQSKIKNTGSTDIKGYLLMQVQYFNETLQQWVVADDTVNEIVIINSSEQLALDQFFNGEVNTNDLSEFGSGTYRIYAAFRDPYGNILKCDDETELVATYEFDIIFE